MSERATKNTETLLSYFLQNAPRDRIPIDASPSTLHPFTSSSVDDPRQVLTNLLVASETLSRTLHAYSLFTASDHKLVSILRQSTTLIQGLHTSHRDAQQRVRALRSRSAGGATPVYGEPIPLDDEELADWCISRIEDWGKKSGMEVFREEGRNGKTTIILGGKVLVIDVDLTIQRNSSSSAASLATIANVKTSHALPSGNSGNNALAERSGSLDAFILRTWNSYFDVVQKNDTHSSMRAAQISRDIQSHLSYLMRLDSLAFREGDQGIRWFNDTGLMSAITDKISKTEVDSLSTVLQTSPVSLDIFCFRAHALGVSHLVSPSMSFLVYLPPLSYYSLLRLSSRGALNSSASRHDSTDPFGNLDIPLPILREQLTQRHLRPLGVVIATLTLTSVTGILPQERHPEQRPPFTRPYFRLPGTSGLDALDHVFLTGPIVPADGPDRGLNLARDVWVLDFTDAGQAPGIVVTHSRMRDIQQVINPISTSGGMGFAMQMQMPPLPGNWVGLLINPAFPPSARYIATYKSPSNSHPPLRLRLTAPNEAGFLLQRVPVRSLKDVYGVLEIVRDQCWINETLKTVNWIAEDLMPGDEDERDDTDAAGAGAAEEELDALLQGTYPPRRIPVNVFLPDHPPSSPNNTDTADGLDLDTEHVVPGLSSVSMPVGGNTPAPRIALTFAIHEPTLTNVGSHVSPAQGSCRAALVLRHDRTRKRGLRLDINVASLNGIGFGGGLGDRAPSELIEELEESSRRGGAFGTAGKVWSWLTTKDK